MGSLFENAPLVKLFYYVQWLSFFVVYFAYRSTSRSKIPIWIDIFNLFIDTSSMICASFIAFRLRFVERGLGSHKATILWIATQCFSLLCLLFVKQFTYLSQLFHLSHVHTFKSFYKISCYASFYAFIFYYLRYFPGTLHAPLSQTCQDKLTLSIFAIYLWWSSFEAFKITLSFSILAGYLASILFYCNVGHVQALRFPKSLVALLSSLVVVFSLQLM